MRRYGESKVFGQTYRARPGVYALLSRNERVLLTYQGGIHHEFQFPGGGIDPGESPIAALHREVFEETGWRIASPTFIRSFRRFVYMPEYDMWAEKICRIYRAFPVRQLSEPPEPDHSAHWVSTEEASLLLGNPGERDVLNTIL
ncbi:MULTISPECIES: NUDIX hydrolase [Roseobacteraceae]|uniref:NUDIX family hydrolase n=1 Tax=Celeribacter baekdonensis B30 TaxID=1208323 RepID=K2JH63_9RHOB|nr:MULTISPECIES: NUDIX hydrolase [Roseobacteraceae]EKE74513.1 NUDIX family hydrolase [Celeribacter baekdonensis B30]KAB6716575.1 NUDIX domain-containing protein [Roseobacter sp. TSBP12]|tara:strand:+ start:867 stop:1298 length:432 start_codon:yes stop_codon:yes gene_type:complete